MSRTLPALIFDLDGTLTDSKPGILGCLRKVLESHSIHYPGSLDRFIGPPVEAWTAELLPDASEEERAALASEYRACYGREGWNNNSVYPGVREMLTQLRREGFPLYVCTSKHRPFAMRILDSFELSPFFLAIYGDKAEYPSHSKVDLLARLLQECALDPGATWMIGDRMHDIEAAHASHVRCLAVRWGYGSPEECAPADAYAAAPADVLAQVMPGGFELARAAAPRTLPE